MPEYRVRDHFRLQFVLRFLHRICRVKYCWFSVIRIVQRIAMHLRVYTIYMYTYTNFIQYTYIYERTIRSPLDPIWVGQTRRPLAKMRRVAEKWKNFASPMLIRRIRAKAIMLTYLWTPRPTNHPSIIVFVTICVRDPRVRLPQYSKARGGERIDFTADIVVLLLSVWFMASRKFLFSYFLIFLWTFFHYYYFFSRKSAIIICWQKAEKFRRLSLKTSACAATRVPRATNVPVRRQRFVPMRSVRTTEYTNFYGTPREKQWRITYFKVHTFPLGFFFFSSHTTQTQLVERRGKMARALHLQYIILIRCWKLA